MVAAGLTSYFKYNCLWTKPKLRGKGWEIHQDDQLEFVSQKEWEKIQNDKWLEKRLKEIDIEIVEERYWARRLPNPWAEESGNFN
jgi:hypothetical protein